MDKHASIPFPLLPHVDDQSSKRPLHQPRLHSTPSLPNLWLPPHCGPMPAHLARAHQSPSPSITRTYQIPRPHLKPLDLAASPPNSSAPYPTPSTPTSKSRPLTRPANLLTPPLTPSSSFGDSSSGSTHTNGFGTSPQFSGSPSARWRRSMASHGQTTPSTDRSRSLDHDPTIDTSGDVDDNLVATLQSSLSLEEGNKASSTTPSRFLLITHVPKILEAESLKALFAPFRDGINRMNIKLQAEYGVVILAFYDEKEAEKAKARIGGLSVKSAFPTQCQRGLGRDQKNGPFNECGREGAETGEGKLGVGYVSAAKLRQLIGESGFADEVERQAEFYLSIDSAPEVSKGISVDMSKVTNTLGSFGALKSFDRDNGLSGEVYRVEFYDIRHAADAFDGFIKRAGFGRRIRLSRQKPGSFYDDHTPRSPRSPLPSPKSTLKEFGESTPSTSAVRLPSDPLARVKAMSMSEDPKGDAARAAKSLPLNSDLSRRRSNYDVFESGERRENGPTVEVGMAVIDPARSSADPAVGGPVSDPDEYSPPRPKYVPFVPSPSSIYPSASTEEFNPSAPENWVYATSPTPATAYYTPEGGVYYYHPPQSNVQILPRNMLPSHGYRPEFEMRGLQHHPRPEYSEYVQLPFVYARPLPPSHTSSFGPAPHFEDPHVASHLDYPTYPDPNGNHYTFIDQFQGSLSSHSPPHVGWSQYPLATPDSSYHQSSFPGPQSPLGEPSQPAQRNQIDIQRIEDGADTRTTVMIKNIPNKMSDKDLIAYIGRVCPRRIDFLYLRMDFQNGCNVGYAFVNFITVQDLLLFAQTKLGIKWNMYSSEKVLQMSYANYQGKEALVEKFKNSCIMDEREEWRPKIFHSDGPQQGLPEPFPKPTHLRRKERSSHNRGALFVPGVHHHNNVHQQHERTRDSRQDGGGRLDASYYLPPFKRGRPSP